MKSDEIRSHRINELYRKAKTGKYTWVRLLALAKSTGVNQQTAKSYIDAVEAKLIKEGLLK